MESVDFLDSESLEKSFVEDEKTTGVMESDTTNGQSAFQVKMLIGIPK